MKLSIFTIALNESKHLDFWYNNHKDLADEIVLVDTGSTDDTVEKAKRLGIKVYSYKWQHSFCKAKNFARKQCTGDWLLSLSPDFWIDKKDFHLIKQTIQNSKYDTYWMPYIHHLYDWFKGKTKPCLEHEKHIILSKNNPKIYYCGNIHETIDSSIQLGKFSVSRLDIIRHHDSINHRADNPLKMQYYDEIKNNWSLNIQWQSEMDKLRKRIY